VDPTYARVRSSIRGSVRASSSPSCPQRHPRAPQSIRAGEVADCGTDEDRPPVTLDELACALLNAAIPETVPTTGTMAIDGTDIET